NGNIFTRVGGQFNIGRLGLGGLRKGHRVSILLSPHPYNSLCASFVEYTNLHIIEAKYKTMSWI
ncbi:MAG: hypothetical protein O6852_03545, partial [Gammaproteobacteria bacterium]|nr:hypothetical protein [Gammaproteobacteria bacterium]